MSEYEDLLRNIEAFRPVEGNWIELDPLVERLWHYNLRVEDLPTLFAVFERFPDEDGAGVLWSLVHGIESTSLPYEPFLTASFQKQPSLMAGIMLKRIQNTIGLVSHGDSDSKRSE